MFIPALISSHSHSIFSRAWWSRVLTASLMGHTRSPKPGRSRRAMRRAMRRSRRRRRRRVSAAPVVSRRSSLARLSWAWPSCAGGGGGKQRASDAVCDIQCRNTGSRARPRPAMASDTDPPRRRRRPDVALSDGAERRRDDRERERAERNGAGRVESASASRDWRDRATT